MGRRPRWLAAPLGLALAVFAVRGCGSGDDAIEHEPPDGDAATEPDAVVDRGGERDTTSGGDILGPDIGSDVDATDGAECSPRTIPPDVPAGWVEFPVMDCKYRLYVPPTKDLLPEGLTWEPCTTDLGPDTFDCRQIHVDWPSVHDPPYAIGDVSPAYVEDDGRVVLQLNKAYRRTSAGGDVEKGTMSMVVEADGSVRQALWTDYGVDTWLPMVLSGRSVSRSKSTWEVSEWDGSHVVRVVSLGGDDTDLSPPVLMDRLADSPDAALAYAGPSYWLEQGSQRRIVGWDGMDHGLVSNHPTTALSPAQWVGDTLLWAYESGYTHRLWTWTKPDGARELTPFPADNSTGAGNPASDGKDLVWVQGEDLTPADEWWPTRSIMTAPFTTDPSKLQPRRLRSWRLPWIGTSFNLPVVGCGHAAFLYGSADGSNAELTLLIVRLLDGVAWELHGPSMPGPHWHSPIAITCSEVFTIFEGPMWSVRRIRLDSLGPGLPAD